jgi:hypothetical protein
MYMGHHQPKWQLISRRFVIRGDNPVAGNVVANQRRHIFHEILDIRLESDWTLTVEHRRDFEHRVRVVDCVPRDV